MADRDDCSDRVDHHGLVHRSSSQASASEVRHSAACCARHQCHQVGTGVGNDTAWGWTGRRLESVATARRGGVFLRVSVTSVCGVLDSWWTLEATMTAWRSCWRVASAEHRCWAGIVIGRLTFGEGSAPRPIWCRACSLGEWSTASFLSRAPRNGKRTELQRTEHPDSVFVLHKRAFHAACGMRRWKAGTTSPDVEDRNPLIPSDQVLSYFSARNPFPPHHFRAAPHQNPGDDLAGGTRETAVLAAEPAPGQSDPEAADQARHDVSA